MTRWGLVIETTMGVGERKHTEANVVAHLTGRREEALAELERRARSHSPEHTEEIGRHADGVPVSPAWPGRDDLP